jgi:hypothetical protein
VEFEKKIETKIKLKLIKMIKEKKTYEAIIQELQNIKIEDAQNIEIEDPM